MEAKHLQLKHTFLTGNSLFYILAAVLFVILNMLVCYQIIHARGVLLLGVSAAFMLLVIYIVIAAVERKRLVATPTIFLLLLVFQGLLYMAVFLPMTVPDEVYHFFQSYLYSNVLMLVPSNPDGVTMRGSDVAFLGEVSTMLSGEYYSKVAGEFALFQMTLYCRMLLCTQAANLTWGLIHLKPNFFLPLALPLEGSWDWALSPSIIWEGYSTLPVLPL